MGLKVIKANQEELNKKLYEINGLLVNLITELGLDQNQKYEEVAGEDISCGLVRDIINSQQSSYDLLDFTKSKIVELHTLID